MPLRLGPITLPWPGSGARHDPYWDFFLNTPASDPKNSIVNLIQNAPEGAVFPAKAELHTPEITSGHIKELATYLGADLVGIIGLDPGEEYPFAVICAVRADVDPRQAPGIGGQIPVQNGLFVTFILAAYIRELGYRATASTDPNAEQLAARAGLGTLNAQGRLVTPRLGTNVHVANVIRTDLPLVADR